MKQLKRFLLLPLLSFPIILSSCGSSKLQHATTISPKEFMDNMNAVVDKINNWQPILKKFSNVPISKFTSKNIWNFVEPVKINFDNSKYQFKTELIYIEPNPKLDFSPIKYEISQNEYEYQYYNYYWAFDKCDTNINGLSNQNNFHQINNSSFFFMLIEIKENYVWKEQFKWNFFSNLSWKDQNDKPIRPFICDYNPLPKPNNILSYNDLVQLYPEKGSSWVKSEWKRNYKQNYLNYFQENPNLKTIHKHKF